jgi:hypothetical protein
LKFWLKGVPVDMTALNAAQVIYVSTPVFVDRADPLTVRLLRMPGAHRRVAVPDAPAPRPPVPVYKPVKPTPGLSPYGEVALDGECWSIVSAPEGERDRAIIGGAYRMGQLVGAGALPHDFTLHNLHRAAAQLPGYSKRDASKVDRAFAAGLRNPREAQHG